MSLEAYVLDASSSHSGLFCFCPVEFDDQGEVESIVFGLSLLSTEPPSGSRFVGVVHEAGQEAVEQWCEENQEIVDDLRSRFGSPPEVDQA